MDHTIIRDNMLIDAITDAQNGDEISVPVMTDSDRIKLTKEQWESVVTKELDIQVKMVNYYDEVMSVITLSHEKMSVEFEENTDYVTMYLGIYDNYTTGKSISFYVSQYTAENEWIQDGLDGFETDVKVYVGDRFKNGEEVYKVDLYQHIVNKDMKKQTVASVAGDPYIVEAGMISLHVNGNDYMSVDAKREVEIAPVPDFGDAKYADKEQILTAETGKIYDLNVAGTDGNFTVVTEFNVEVEDDATYYYSVPLFSMDNRDAAYAGGHKYMFMSIRTDGAVVYSDGMFSELSQRVDKLANGKHTLYVNLYHKDDIQYVTVCLDNTKVIDYPVSDTSVFNTFYCADYPSTYNYGMGQGVITDITSKVYAGTMLPENITEIDTLQETDSITGDLKVTTFFNEKTDAVALESGDSYTFKFNNKSNGTEVWENFVMAITGATGYEYMGSNEEVMIIRADSWGWGGEMSDFIYPDSGYGNPLVFKNDITDFEAFKSDLQAGVDCEVTVSRDGDTITYEAKIGKYTVSCIATSGIVLPEKCYVFFTGQNCDLTGFKTIDNNDTVIEEPTTEEPTEEPTTEAPTEAPTEEPTTEPEKVVTTEKGKNSAAQTIDENKIVEADKVVDTAIEKMATSVLKTIEVISNEAKTLTKDVFETMQKEGKNLTIGVTDENNQLQYSWTFANRTLKNTDMDIDLSIKFDTEKQAEIEKLTGRKNSLYIDFAHHGELPGPATIKTYVGDRYKNGEVVYLYYFDEEAQKVLLVGNKPLEVKAGYVEYTITHCSVYFLDAEKLEGVELDARSLKDATISVLDDAGIDAALNDLPQTGDTANVSMIIMLVCAAAAMMMAGILKVRKNN